MTHEQSELEMIAESFLSSAQYLEDRRTIMVDILRERASRVPRGDFPRFEEAAGLSHKHLSRTLAGYGSIFTLAKAIVGTREWAG